MEPNMELGGGNDDRAAGLGETSVIAAPLRGVRVVEIGSHFAGPFCATQLGDLGADVVKVESPDRGDALRANEPTLGGEAAIFLQIGRNKRSMALDLKQPEGRVAFERLVARTDVVVENLRPGTMEHLGLAPEYLCERNPRLVYVAVSGWGRSGPYADRAGLDIMAQGMSGIMSVTGAEGGAPAKAGVPICDLTCALYGALAAVSALRVRDATGCGQIIDVNLFEAGVSLTLWEAARYFGSGEVPHAMGSAHQNGVPYQAVRAADGYLTVGAPTQALWERLCGVLHLEQLVDDPRFCDNVARREHRRELIALIEEVTVTQTRHQWTQRLLDAGVPCGEVLTYDQVVVDPHLEARRYFARVDHPTAGGVSLLGSAMRMGAGVERTVRAPSPILGQHTKEVLTELGYGAAEIEAFERTGAAVCTALPSRFPSAG